MLKDEDQLTANVKVIPGEESLLWQERRHSLFIPYDFGHKHPFYKVNTQ